MNTKPPAAGGATPEPGSFLDRWSRRKRAVAAGVAVPETEAPAAPAAPADGVPELQPDAPQQAALETAPGQEPEAFVEPPALETIGPDFDLSYWLRQKVPEAWKRQALRQAWTADPAIRDFKGLADYDLDYNTPGMAPGYGPLTESDDVAAMVRKIFGEQTPEEIARDSQPQESPAPDATAASGDAVVASQHAEASEDDAAGDPDEDRPEIASGTDIAPPNDANRDVAAQQADADLRGNPQTIVRIRRRGGGAIPT